METIEVKVLEMYDLQAFIFGFQSPTFNTPGFINEKNPELKESTKRIVAKAGKVVTNLLKDIAEQREKIQQFVPEGFVTVDTEGKTEEEVKQLTNAQLAPIRKEKDDELLNSIEKIEIEKPLFSLVANLSFPNNYTFLYDKIFKD